MWYFLYYSCAWDTAMFTVLRITSSEHQKEQKVQKKQVHSSLTTSKCLQILDLYSILYYEFDHQFGLILLIQACNKQQRSQTFLPQWWQKSPKRALFCCLNQQLHCNDQMMNLLQHSWIQKKLFHYKSWWYVSN